MRIGIEAQRLFRKRKFGMDIVALEIITELQKIDRQNEYFIFVASGKNGILKETTNFNIYEISMKLYPVWEQIGLVKAAKKIKLDMLHFTANTAPLWIKIPYILTLHDTISMEQSLLLKQNKTWYQWFGNHYRYSVIPRAASRSQHIITVSETERQNIINHLNIAPEKISVVHNGVNDSFKPITDRSIINRFNEKYKLPEKFNLGIGNTEPRKNTINLLKAYQEYYTNSGEKKALVMLHNDRNTLITQIQNAGLSEQVKQNIIALDYVDAIDMPVLFSEADMFLYPSQREGFGIPILEAMACGTPVITSNTSSMPEVGGNAALYVSPFDVRNIAEQMLYLETHPEKCNEMIDAGLAHSKKFKWNNTAQNVLSVYQKTYAHFTQKNTKNMVKKKVEVL